MIEIMRIAAAFLCVASVAAADPIVPHRKLATADYPVDALQLFVSGLVLDLGDRYTFAHNAYDASFTKSRQPNTIFNMALLDLRAESTTEAIREFTQYLDLAKTAPDRAEIERLMADLRAAKPSVTIGGEALDVDEADAVILVDGAIVGASPVTLRLAPGIHLAERITATTYAHLDVNAKPGEASYVAVNASHSSGGNVVISGLGRELRWREDNLELASMMRFALPVGHYKISGRDYAGRPLACSPIEFDVKSATALTYVNVALVPGAKPQECARVDRVAVQVVVPK
jgi:hypothetical protein